MTLPNEDFAPEETSGALVHWMAPGRVRLERAGVSATAIAAFALGAVAAFGALAAARWVAPRREGLPPWKWARGPLN